MRQVNINPMIGACVESTNIMVISPYCAKGSLLDVLESDTVSMIRSNSLFKMAFIQDIAQVGEDLQLYVTSMSLFVP